MGLFVSALVKRTQAATVINLVTTIVLTAGADVHLRVLVVDDGQRVPAQPAGAARRLARSRRSRGGRPRRCCTSTRSSPSSTSSAAPRPGSAAPARSSRAVTDFDAVVNGNIGDQGFGIDRDTFWPRAVAAMLVAAVVLVDPVGPDGVADAALADPSSPRRRPPAPSRSRRSPDGAAAARPPLAAAASARRDRPRSSPPIPATLGRRARPGAGRRCGPASSRIAAGCGSGASVRRAWYVLAARGRRRARARDRACASAPARVGAAARGRGPDRRAPRAARCWSSAARPSHRRDGPRARRRGRVRRRAGVGARVRPGDARRRRARQAPTTTRRSSSARASSSARPRRRFVRRQRRDAVGRLRTIEPGLFRPAPRASGPRWSRSSPACCSSRRCCCPTRRTP